MLEHRTIFDVSKQYKRGNIKYTVRTGNGREFVIVVEPVTDTECRDQHRPPESRDVRVTSNPVVLAVWDFFYFYCDFQLMQD